MPIAIQNLFVATSFRFIFTPGASRLYARGDRKALNDLYWQTAAWIAILTFPFFALCVGFAEPLDGAALRRAIPRCRHRPEHPVRRLLRERGTRLQLAASCACSAGSGTWSRPT